MLLKLNSSTKRVAWPHAEVETQEVESISLEQSTSGTIGEPISLQHMTTVSRQRAETDRLQALASLDYDSDGDDSNAERELELEFEDNQEHGADSFHDYVEKENYFEKDDVSFSPDVWNDSPDVRASHNCYMYALNDLSPKSQSLCKQTHKLVKFFNKNKKKGGKRKGKRAGKSKLGKAASIVRTWRAVGS